MPGNFLTAAKIDRSLCHYCKESPAKKKRLTRKFARGGVNQRGISIAPIGLCFGKATVEFINAEVIDESSEGERVLILAARKESEKKT